MSPILETLQWCDEVIVWDNSERHDLQVMGRYAAIAEAKGDVIVTQDDDCLVPWDQFMASPWDGKSLLVNVTEGERPWLAWGAIFPREEPFIALARYMTAYGIDQDFFEWPDVIFTELTDVTYNNVGHENFPYAYGPDRMYTRGAVHEEGQERVRQKCARL